MSRSGEGRKYQDTHPWLTFSFDARQLDHRIWLLLGEAQSKCEHIQGAPLLPEISQRFYSLYLAKGALATTAIEGNTLTEEEVNRRIRGDLKLPPSKEYLGQEIDNVVAAFNRIGNALLESDGPAKLRVEDICEFNRLVLKDLPLDEDVIPGEIGKYPVGVARYRAAPPEDCEYLLERYVTWLNDQFVLPDDDRAVYGILKAILAHLYFVWIHPFGDGNGRTARLIEFQILLSAGIPASAAHLLSNHYNQTRSEYYRHLDRASKSGGDVSRFILYALQGLVDGLKQEIEAIQEQQLSVHWINHIHNTFHGKNAQTDVRKKELVLEITQSRRQEFSLQEVRRLTPRIAELYAALSERTVSRDISDLVEMALLIRQNDGYSCNFKLLRLSLARVPARKP